MKSLVTAAAYVAIVAALMYAALFQLEPGAPFRMNPDGGARISMPNKAMGEVSNRLNRASAGRNVVLRMTGVRVDDMSAAAAFYRAAYDLYPRRVYAAMPDRVVNGTADLLGPWPEGADFDRRDLGGAVHYPLDP